MSAMHSRHGGTTGRSHSPGSLPIFEEDSKAGLVWLGSVVRMEDSSV